jgi:hypothetical protein
LEFANPPVVFEVEGFQKDIGPTSFSVKVYGKAYDYGVLSVILDFPINDLPFSSFKEVALILEHDTDVDRLCKDRLSALVALFEDCITAPKVSRFEEDYTIYFIESYRPDIGIRDFLGESMLPQLMLSEQKRLARRITEELMASCFSYYEDDLFVVNWDNAFIIEPSGTMELPDLLEFANAQLLELRYYDHVVEKELDSIYQSISEKGALSVWHIRKYESIAARIMRTVAELTEITEKIDASLKVTEDVYYAKVYAAALRLLRVKEWEAGIRKKLSIASGICDLLYREIANKRTEILELAIVLLILFEILIIFILK